jgi:protein phosphatase
MSSAGKSNTGADERGMPFDPDPALVSGCQELAGWEVAWAQLQGTQHQQNEDSVGFRLLNVDGEVSHSGTWIAVGVADGVGGGACGDVASRVLIDYCLAIPPVSLNDIDSVRTYMATADSHLQAALRQVTTRPGASMLAAAWLHTQTGRAYTMRVGDARLYRIVPDPVTVEQLTVDQNYAQLGEPAPPDHSPLEPARMVGTGVMGSPEVMLAHVTKGDTLLLCTDGFYWGLSEADIAGKYQRPSLRAACSQLVLKSRNGGSSDDISVLAIRRVERYDVGGSHGN